MYVRFVHAKSKPGLSLIIQELYNKIIIPQLKRTPGCLCSCLIQSDSQRDEGISMTLWDSEKEAEAYEASGSFRDLLQHIIPFLSDSSEWKIQLSEKLTLEYKPVPEEPVMKAYRTFIQTDSTLPLERASTLLSMRILSLTINSGMLEEFRNIYREEILPTLRSVKGFRYAFLMENAENQSEVLSLTLWDSREDAANYERSELFKVLMGKLQHTFSGLFHWKVALEQESGGRIITTEDPRSKNYVIVTGEFFRR